MSEYLKCDLCLSDCQGAGTCARTGEKLLLAPVGTPQDFEWPIWAHAHRVHEWKNYINDEVRAMWASFTRDQRAALARQAKERADSEDWE